jgi:hypothetical protein
MSNLNFKEILRNQARIVDPKWDPSDEQLDEIRLVIISKIKNGEVISHTELKRIITQITGQVRVMICDSVDNSDLNMLLASATQIVDDIDLNMLLASATQKD